MKRLSIFLLALITFASCSDSESTDDTTDSTEATETETSSDTTEAVSEADPVEELKTFMESFPHRVDGRLWLHESFFRKGRWDTSVEIDETWIKKLGLDGANGMKYLKFTKDEKRNSFVLAHTTDYSGSGKVDHELWFYKFGIDGALKYKVKLAQTKWNGEKWVDRISAKRIGNTNSYMTYVDDLDVYENLDRKIIYMHDEEYVEKDLTMFEGFMVDAEEEEGAGPIAYFSPTGDPSNRTAFVISDELNNEHGFFEWPEMSFYVRDGIIGSRFRIYHIPEDEENGLIDIDQIPGGSVNLIKLSQIDSLGPEKYNAWGSYKNGVRKYQFKQDPRSFGMVSFYFSAKKNDEGKTIYPVEYISKILDK